MFTDGLPEATMRSGEALGYERLPEFLARRDGEATEWLDAVLKELRDKTVESLEDDWTALVLERV
jgi:serine phosphatase RsbU (regulator of sigma subunit)